jgi:hypothetical protein
MEAAADLPAPFLPSSPALFFFCSDAFFDEFDRFMGANMPISHSAQRTCYKPLNSNGEPCDILILRD